MVVVMGGQRSQTASFAAVGVGSDSPDATKHGGRLHLPDTEVSADVANLSAILQDCSNVSLPTTSITRSVSLCLDR